MTTKAKAKASIFDRKDPHPELAVKHDPDQHFDVELEQALEGTFPASDPAALCQPTTAGSKTRHKPAK